MMKKANAKGQPLTCKFCHKEVWYDDIEGRYYNVGGEELHVESCELRKRFYQNQAADHAQARRNR